MATRYVAAQGALGAGVDREAFCEALDTTHPDFIACDAGTTDAGPFSLGSGVPAFPRPTVLSDLDIILTGARRLGVPVLIGSAGTAGSDGQVDWTVDIVREIAAQRGFRPRVAAIYTEQRPDYLTAMLADGRVRPLDNAPPVDRSTFDRNERTVAMIGVEPLQEALRQGAELIVAGRCSDAALFAALPLLDGCAPGPAWHAAKVAECGSMAFETPGRGVLAAAVDDRGALITAVGAGLRATPMSVAAHSLYETADPYRFVESGGTCDVSGASYEAVNDRTVRITGSAFEPAAEYTVKLEGARKVGYASVIVGGIHDPYLLRRLDRWLDQVRAELARRVGEVLGDTLGPDDYRLAIHRYGHDGVMGEREPGIEVPREVGVVVEVLAPTQHLASTVAALARQPLLHRPIPEWSGGVSTFAFLHNPAHLDRGPVYEFTLNHVLVPREPAEVSRTVWETL
ncbi:acyclic terpene utilization AtuA family protein [Actinophytocola sp.]|uniref:acyclic terpene utilization AtuA family protein n=1 Tax=Actinophytocola sp. TaxID=1872138 RepID=UPI003D6AA09F